MQGMSHILSVAPLGFQWPTIDPFLFCVHHHDAYPAGNGRMGLDPQQLRGRQMGQDFSGKDGWSMYHGQSVPGFPAHPHRGFETVTIVRHGRIDHSDSLGATARFGGGDVQWLTAGQGIVHCEMFPLLHTEAPNPTELFQIWLNLPAKSKMAQPHFTMFWNESIPRWVAQDEHGRATEVVCIAGPMLGQQTLPPPPASWASETGSEVGIYTIKMAPGARWQLPAALNPLTRRMLYFFSGTALSVAGQSVPVGSAVEVRAGEPSDLHNGDRETELLVLQAKPIAEPVAQYGPFVMNTEAEIRQAFADYQRTEFGGWPWRAPDPVHPPTEDRFARRANGQIERPTTPSP